MSDPTSSALKDRITQAVKDAMRAREKARLGALRLITAEFKRVEVDERIELDDDRVIAILDKMRKQRQDAETQYRDAGRDELAAQERFEIDLIETFLPAALSDTELDTLIADAIAEVGAAGMQDMGKVMGRLKPQLAGRADMGAVSGKVRAALG